MHDRPEAAPAPVELARSFMGRPGKINVIDHLATNERGRATNGALIEPTRHEARSSTRDAISQTDRAPVALPHTVVGRDIAAEPPQSGDNRRVSAARAPDQRR
jgi:hypothetical protein